VKNGVLKSSGNYLLCRVDGSQLPVKVTQLYGWRGLKRTEVDTVSAGDIVAVAGIEEIHIGDTITDAEDPRPLPALSAVTRPPCNSVRRRTSARRWASSR
jgi:GTP-binding protein